MPLSFEVLERIRFEHLADDLEVEARMLAWTYEQADAYFESGGMHEPRPPSRPPEPSEPEPDATGSATAADRPPPVGRKAGPSRPAAAGGEREGDAAQTATGRTTRREEECTNEGAAESITTAQSACELSGPEAMASRDRRRRVAAAGEGTGVAALEERGVDVDELSVLAADHPAVVADRLKQLGYDTLGSRVQIVVQLKDRYRAAQRRAMFTGEPLQFSPRDAARGADTLPGAAPPKPAVREWNGPPWREESAFEVKGGLSSPYYHASLPKEAPPPLKLSAEQLHAAANAVKETHSALHGPYYYAHNRRVDFVIPTPPPKLLSVAKRVPPPLEDNGGAVLILSPGRRHLWPKPPRALHVVDAVMGACLPSTAVTDLNKHARQELTRGELGILKSNRRAWQYALDKKWDWALVLEDDAVFEGISSKISSSATAEFLTRLPAIVRAATSASPDWQLLVLTPINQPWDFFASLDGSLVPDLISHGGKMRSPLAVAPGQPRYGQHTMRRGGSASSARSAALGLYTDAKGSAARRRLREGTGSESEVLVEAIDCNGAVEWSARGEICHGSLHVDPTPYSSAMLGAVRTDAIEWSNGSVWRRCDLSVPIGSVDGLHVTSISWEDATCSWYHCPPTFHAFGWIYRKDLIKDCVGAFDARAPPLNPLDVWIWEVMATRGKLAQALAPAKPLVNSLGVGNTASCPSVKEQQDRPDTLHRIHARRGHG